MPTEYSPSGGRSKSTLARSSASGTWVRMPAPSPEFGSEPAAPRWSRLCSAVRPAATIDARPAAAGVGHEGDTAGVLVVRRVVEAGDRAGRPRRARRSGGPESTAAGAVRSDMSLPSSAAVRTSGAGPGRGRGPGPVVRGRRSKAARAEEPAAGGTVVPARRRLASPPGGVRWAVVRGATLARFRRGRPGQDRRRVCSEGYTAVTPAPCCSNAVATARRQDPCGNWPTTRCRCGSVGALRPAGSSAGAVGPARRRHRRRDGVVLGRRLAPVDDLPRPAALPDEVGDGQQADDRPR